MTKKVGIFIACLALLAGCDSSKLSKNLINIEKDKIRDRIDLFLLSYEKKDPHTLLSIISTSQDFYFLGSDVSEVSRSNADYQNQLERDWKLFDSIEFGEIRKISIQVSKDGDIADALYEVPITTIVQGSQSKFFLRISSTFIKEDGIWMLIQGMVSIPSIGESSVELNRRLNLSQ